jgi:sugar/nucleoside kinase (ribokinase family)
VSILTLGATNLDHTFRLKAPLRMGDSNPVHDTITVGGVGFNMASHLEKLTADSHFLTAFDRPITLQRATVIPLDQAPAYYAVMEDDMTVAFAAMDALETMDVTPFLPALKALTPEDTLLMDLNYPEAFIEKVLEITPAKIIVEATSAHKIMKIKPYLKTLYGLKCNALEAMTLTGQAHLASAIDALERTVVPLILVTMKDEGAMEIKESVTHYQDHAPFVAHDLTGVGDAFMAGYLAASDAPVEGAMALSAMIARMSGATDLDLTSKTWTQERKQRDVSIQTRRPRRPQQ